MTNDHLTDRLAYFFSVRKGQEFSALKIARILRVNDVEQIKSRLEHAKSRGRLIAREGRIYNGKPVILYSVAEK